jgi:hypothetical protein
MKRRLEAIHDCRNVRMSGSTPTTEFVLVDPIPGNPQLPRPRQMAREVVGFAFSTDAHAEDRVLIKLLDRMRNEKYSVKVVGSGAYWDAYF